MWLGEEGHMGTSLELTAAGDQEPRPGYVKVIMECRPTQEAATHEVSSDDAADHDADPDTRYVIR